MISQKATKPARAGSAPDGRPASGSESLKPANPEFEQLVKGPALEPKKENRGGLRPGAGRPMGVSDDMAEINRLPEVPHSSIKILVEIPFELWAAVNGMPELALSKEEARTVSLSITRLAEYYCPGITKGIMFEWLALGGLITGVTKSRLEKIQQRKAAGKVVNGGGPGSSPTSQVPAAGSKLSDMVQPASGHIRTA